MRPELFQNLPIGGVVVNCWQFGERLPKHLRNGNIRGRVTLEGRYFDVILQNKQPEVLQRETEKLN